MKKTKLWVRVLAVALAALIVGGAVVSILVSTAGAEETVNDACEMEITYLQEEQALHIRQRLVFHNRTDGPLDRVLFQAAANAFRRQSALPYEAGDWGDVFPSGYLPSGMDLVEVRVDGTPADYGFQGENETALRVACQLAPGAQAAFEFDYYLLLTQCSAFCGLGDTDVRLSGFCFLPGIPAGGDFVLRQPLGFTRFVETAATDFAVTLSLPEGCIPGGTGAARAEAGEEGETLWRIEAKGVRDFALSFSRRWRETTAVADSGVTLRWLGTGRSGGNVLRLARQALELYEEWLGPFPYEGFDILQSDIAPSALSFPGCLWLPEAALSDEVALKQTLWSALAGQYIGQAAWTEPVADAWLSEAPCSYLALLCEEELNGYEAFLTQLNRVVLDSLNITLPGGLRVSSSADLFLREEYELIVVGRGTVVMHEMRQAVGREAFLDAMRRFYEMGLGRDVLTELDLARAFDEAAGGSWEPYLTGWLFGVEEYLQQRVEWYE